MPPAKENAGSEMTKRKGLEKKILRLCRWQSRPTRQGDHVLRRAHISGSRGHVVGPSATPLVIRGRTRIRVPPSSIIHSFAGIIRSRF